jgi:quinol monooxygenase YgiN
VFKSRKKKLIHIVWEFHIKPEKRIEFERYYAGSGHWAELFRQSSAYQGTTLAQDLDRPERYLLTDRWESIDAFHNFRQDFREAYEQLDQLCEQFTTQECCLGIFQVE